MSSHLLALPANWATAALDEVAEVVQGQSPPGQSYNFTGEGAPFLQGKAEFGAMFPTAIKWCSMPSKFAQPGDVLLSVRAPVGSTNLADDNYCIGRGLAAIRPLGGMSGRFILYSIRATIEDLTANATGTTFPAITGEVLRGHMIPLPPLAEQRRIVEEIEKQFTRLDAAVEALRTAQAKLKRYRASVLNAAVTGRLVPTEAALARAEGREYEDASVLLERIARERRAQEQAKPRRKRLALAPVDTSALPELPEGWAWGSLDQLAAMLRNGYSQRPHGTTGTAILRISAVRPMTVDLEDIRWVDDASKLAGFLIDSGDLLFTRYNGNPSLVGVCGVVPSLKQNTLHPDKLIRVKLINIGTLPEFVGIVANVGYSRKFLQNRIRTTAGQSGIAGTDLKPMPIPVPPLAEQHRIAAEVDRRLSVVRQAEAAVEANLKRAERLRQAVLKRAFEGRLVPQDPDDEPASVLLERIRTEKAAAERERRRRGRRRRRARLE